MISKWANSRLWVMLFAFVLVSIASTGLVSAEVAKDYHDLGIGGLGVDLDENDLINFNGADPVTSSDFNIIIKNRSRIIVTTTNPNKVIYKHTDGTNVTLGQYLGEGGVLLTDRNTDGDLSYGDDSGSDVTFGLTIHGFDNNDSITSQMSANGIDDHLGTISPSLITGLKLKLEIYDKKSVGDDSTFYITDTGWKYHGQAFSSLSIDGANITGKENFNISLLVTPDGGDRLSLVSTELGSNVIVFTQCTSDSNIIPVVFKRDGSCGSSGDSIVLDGVSALGLATATGFVPGTYTDGSKTTAISILGGDDPRTSELLILASLDPNSDFDPTCDSEVGFTEPIAWVGCFMLTSADRGLTAFDNKLDGLLKVERDEYSNEGYRTAWRNIRNISTLAVVVTALIMVISTALDMGFFSNYTVKKYLPRLVIGVIAMQLSWVVASLLIVFTNELGDGVARVLLSPFGDGAADLNLATIAGGGINSSGESVIDNGAIFAGVGTGIGVGVAISLGLFGAIALAYSGLVALFIGYVVLIFREMIIILLLIMSPLGVALWILPGNDKVWNFYRKLFISMVMLYPIIIAVTTMGKIFAYISIGSP